MYQRQPCCTFFAGWSSNTCRRPRCQLLSRYRDEVISRQVPRWYKVGSLALIVDMSQLLEESTRHRHGFHGCSLPSGPSMTGKQISKLRQGGYSAQPAKRPPDATAKASLEPTSWAYEIFIDLHVQRNVPDFKEQTWRLDEFEIFEDIFGCRLGRNMPKLSKTRVDFPRVCLDERDPWRHSSAGKSLAVPTKEVGRIGAAWALWRIDDFLWIYED